MQLPARLGFVTVLTDVSEAGSFDLVVETTANPDGLRKAVELIRPNGTILLKSTYADTDFTGFGSLMATIVVNEIMLIGSRCGPFAPALQLLADGAIDTDALIEREYPLSRSLEAFEHAAQTRRSQNPVAPVKIKKTRLQWSGSICLGGNVLYTILPVTFRPNSVSDYRYTLRRKNRFLIFANLVDFATKRVDALVELLDAVFGRQVDAC